MKRVKSYVALTSLVALFLLLLLVPGHRASAAQQTAQADDDPNLIDGAKNPELIPDSLAFRMYYIASTETSPEWGSAQKSEYLRGFFRMPGISDEDLNSVEEILTDFRSQYDQLIVDFNAAATDNLKSGVVTDPSTLTDQFDELTDKTSKRISKVLRDKQGALEAHVQNEKARMKVKIQ